MNTIALSTLRLNSHNSSCVFFVIVLQDGSSLNIGVNSDNYSFTGWYSGNSLISGLAVYSFEMPHYELSYTAKWKANDYTVTMDVNGGKELADDSKTVTYDSSYTLTVPEKDGYDFGGWYTGNYGTGTQLTDASGNSVGVWNIADNTTVYAKWNVITYSLTFHLNGGTVSGENATAYTIEDLDIKINNPVKAGYNFEGWVETGTTEPITALTISAGTFGNRTFGAKWSRNSSFVAISSVSEFKNIANNLNGYYYLTADIDFEGMEVASFGSEETAFTGVLDGNGHKLLNLQTTKGIFANLKGTVCNLYVDNITNYSEFVSTTVYAVGSIAYINNGTIQNCVINSKLIGTTVGGVVHTNNGIIEGCKVIGEITANGRYPNSGYAGGICITNNGYIARVYVAANIIAHAGYFDAFAAGICVTNQNAIEYCVVNANIKAQVNSCDYEWRAYIKAGRIICSGTIGINCYYNQETTISAILYNSNSITSQYATRILNTEGTGTTLANLSNKNFISWDSYVSEADLIANPTHIWVFTGSEIPKLYWEA